MATVMIAHASKDEHNTYRGGEVGDQTGKEVCIRTWYNRPWNVVLCAKNDRMANKIAEAMERAAKNDHIGYDQTQRNSLLYQARKVAYDPGRVTADCETDCSALVSVACMYAGIPESALFVGGNSATTRTLRKRLLATGEFLDFVSPGYTASPKLLARGDILLSEGHHVAVVISSTYTSAVQPGIKTVDEIAKDIIQGKGNWGNGLVRTSRLKEAGYDPAEVQKRINEILKGAK